MVGGSESVFFYNIKTSKLSLELLRIQMIQIFVMCISQKIHYREANKTNLFIFSVLNQLFSLRYIFLNLTAA